MIYGLVSHPVQDFDVWKPVFESDQPRAHAAGIELVHLFRGVDDPNAVSILFTAPSKAAFEAFVHDPILPQLMQKAGVLAPPTFAYFTAA